MLATAGGLVFQPGSDCTFSAYGAADGELKWQTTTQMGTIAGPISYEVDGEQYVAFMAGWGGAAGLYDTVACADGKRATTGRLLAYKLGGTHTLPSAADPEPLYPPPPPITEDAEVLAQGELLWRKHCSFCHTLTAGPGGVLPNLATIAPEAHDLWDAIVLGGLRTDRGMVSFNHVLSADDSRTIQAYVIATAHEAKAERESLALAPPADG